MINEKYPKVVYGYAVLLDNKIENWEVCCNNKHSVYDFNGYWKKDRLRDYKLEKVCWVCKNLKEYEKAFNVLAPRFFKSWKHADDYKLTKAY